MRVRRRAGALPAVGSAVVAAALASGVSSAAIASGARTHAAAGTAASHLIVGFSSDSALERGSASSQDFWLGRARGEGAQLVRYDLTWRQIETTRPRPGSRLDDPNNPAYDWTSVDAAIRRITSEGLSAMVMISSAPRWAEGPNRPRRGVAQGTWSPSPRQYGAFAAAAARRYSGSFPDPLHRGRSLPRVAFWQAWNEPNLWPYLAPQWGWNGSRYVPLSPSIYRGLLNAFYAGVKRVDRSDVVVMGGTAPYGDKPPHGFGRMRPLTFDRALFCLTAAPGCAADVHFDVLDHHPYEFGGPPTQPAYWADDVTVPDMWKLARLVQAGLRAGHILPRSPKPLWVSEIGWDSRPNSTANYSVSTATQAKYVSQASYVLWREGVQTILWEEIRDAPPSATWTFAWCGMYFYRGSSKPAATAFRFPFTAHRQSTTQVQVWGRAPASGILVISQKVDGLPWAPASELTVSRGQVFLQTVPLSGAVSVRASVKGITSLPWAVGR